MLSGVVTVPLLSGVFPTWMSYTGSVITYNLAYTAFDGTSLPVAIWLISSTGNSTAPAFLPDCNSSDGIDWRDDAQGILMHLTARYGAEDATEVRVAIARVGASMPAAFFYCQWIELARETIFAACFQNVRGRYRCFCMARSNANRPSVGIQ